MKLRPTTKAKNKRTIIVNYAVAIIFFSIGMYTGRLIYYVGSVILVSLALFRNHEKIKDFLCPENPTDFLGYWLMKRLKE